jgi:hypothetical protein
MEKGHLTFIAFILRPAVDLPGGYRQDLTQHYNFYGNIVAFVFIFNANIPEMSEI